MKGSRFDRNIRTRVRCRVGKDECHARPVPRQHWDGSYEYFCWKRGRPSASGEWVPEEFIEFEEEIITDDDATSQP